MTKIDIYRARKLLDITASMTRNEIKKAYRRKMAENHPDKHQGDSTKYEELCKQIGIAYEVLQEYMQTDDMWCGSYRRRNNPVYDNPYQSTDKGPKNKYFWQKWRKTNYESFHQKGADDENYYNSGNRDGYNSLDDETDYTSTDRVVIKLDLRKLKH